MCPYQFLSAQQFSSPPKGNKRESSFPTWLRRIIQRAGQHPTEEITHPGRLLFLQAAELNEGMQALIKEAGLTSAFVSTEQQVYQHINLGMGEKQLSPKKWMFVMYKREVESGVKNWIKVQQLKMEHPLPTEAQFLTHISSC